MFKMFMLQCDLSVKCMGLPATIRTFTYTTAFLWTTHVCACYLKLGAQAKNSQMLVSVNTFVEYPCGNVGINK